MSKKWRWFVIAVVTGIGVGLIVWPLFTSAFRGGPLNPDNAAQFGAFVAGYAGTALLLANALLLFWTLQDQSTTAQRERFEAKYFTMLKLHRQNVTELQAGGVTGRAAAKVMRNEIKIIFDKCKAFDQVERARAAFLFLFFGANDDKTLVDLLGQGSAINVCLIAQELLRSQTEYLKGGVAYCFGGQQSQLGHYYRHLYQAIHYVDTQKFLGEQEKYDYVKCSRTTQHRRAGSAPLQ